MAEIKYEVVQRVAVLSQRPRGWERQLNLISWNDGEPKKWKETQISKDYKISWLPTMYLINPEGKVVYTTVLAERMAKKLDEISLPCFLATTFTSPGSKVTRHIT